MTDSLHRVVTALDRIAKTSLVWPRGLINPGGPHRVLAGTLFPVSIGEDECAVFGRLIERFCPAHTFIIGNAFGFSSCYIADVMSQHGGQSVVTLDSEVEGRGRDCARVARRLADTLQLGVLKNKKGRSPEDTAWAVEAQCHDLVFIDGDHRHPQVTRDFEGIFPYTDKRTIFVWHDFWMSGIPSCLRVAESHGMRWLGLPTSCEMILGTRDAATFDDLQGMFPQGIENQQPHSLLLAPAILAKALAQQVWEAATSRFGSTKSIRQTE
ncbi:MAG: class I SAM-dependent methyltransferase [Chloroflexota bacterium]